MTTPSLCTVTLKTVANYRHAAERTLRAYRSGSQRLIAVHTPMPTGSALSRTGLPQRCRRVVSLCKSPARPRCAVKQTSLLPAHTRLQRDCT